MMIRFITRRVGLAILSIWGVASIVFFLSKLIPGDIARVAAGRTASPEQIEAARQLMGLDQPLVLQYAKFLVRAAQGDLGTSAFTHQSVVSDIAAVLPSTIQLVVMALLITIAVAFPLGVVAAVNEGNAADIAGRLIAILGAGVPVFWLAIMLRWLLGAVLGWFPISGSNGFGMAAPNVTGSSILDAFLFGSPEQVADSTWHLVLPAIALSAPFASTLARNIRSNMMTALKSDFVSFAISKGVPSRRVITRHALRSSLGSTLTLIGMQGGWMISAALLVETVFSLPGIGGYLQAGIVNQDTFSVLGGVLVIGMVFIGLALIIDLIQMGLDPRVRLAQIGSK